jgi:hypothetical protein
MIIITGILVVVVVGAVCTLAVLAAIDDGGSGRDEHTRLAYPTQARNVRGGVNHPWKSIHHY